MLLESTVNGLVAVLFLSSVKAEFISTYSCTRTIFFRRLFSLCNFVVCPGEKSEE